jgi:membrane protein DedA with SNARE-associated domain
VEFFSLVGEHPYLFLFFGLLIGGESILVPALYLAVASKLSVVCVIGLALVATVISDTVWYFIGYYLTHQRVARILGPKRELVLERFSKFFSGRKYLIVYLSKFIYGTRIIAQVLAGVYRINFWRYQLVNIAGIFSLNALLLALVYIGHQSTRAAPDQARLYVAGVILVMLVWGSHAVLKKFIYPRWFQ